MGTHNFSRLETINPEMYKMATDSERYLYADHQIALVKLRVFAESFTNYLYNDLQLPNNPNDSFCSKLQKYEFSRAVPRDIIKKLHLLRVNGNDMAHKVIECDQKVVNHCLKESYLLSKWLCFKLDPAITDYPEFVLPENKSIVNQSDSISLDDELEALHRDPDGSIAKRNEVYSKISSEEREKITAVRAKEYADVIQKNHINLYPEETAAYYHLVDEFKGYALTADQQELVAQLEDFLNNDSEHVFLMKGYAGTGKTFILKGVVNYLKNVGRSCSLSAPTGKATLVLREKTGHSASTVHSMIYSLNMLNEYGRNQEGETFKLVFELKDNENPANHVYLIDESSMLSDAMANNEFIQFGSGKLLDDLMHYINLDSNEHAKKVIFIGDDAQLMPVRMNHSPALSEEYFKKLYGDEFPIRSFQLTEVVRQKTDSLILKNALHIRNDLARHQLNRLTIEQDDSEVVGIKAEQFLDTYMMNCNNNMDAQTIVIASKNDLVGMYNMMIRESLYPGAKTIVPGDRIMFSKNTFIDGHRVFNGEFATVTSVGHVESRRIQLNKERIVDLNFRHVQVEFINENGKRIVAPTLLIEDLLTSSNAMLDADEQKALYKDFYIRNTNALKSIAQQMKAENKDDESEEERKRILFNNSHERLKLMMSDPYFNAVQAKYGYAITCHKAQGSEWKRVFLDCQHYNNILSIDGFKWLYTGITRATERLYLLNWWDRRADSNIEVDELKFAENQKQLTSKLQEDCAIDTYLDFELASLSRISQGICRMVVKTLAGQDIIIKKVASHDYHDIYQIQIEGKLEEYKIYYNGKHIIRSISPSNKNNSNQLYTSLNVFVGLLIQIDEKPLMEQTQNVESIVQRAVYPEPFKEFLQAYSEQLEAKLQEHHIGIKEIKCAPYRVRYTFKRGIGTITMDIIYNGKKRVTKTQFIDSLCNDSDLADDIKSVLEEGVM